MAAILGGATSGGTLNRLQCRSTEQTVRGDHAESRRWSPSLISNDVEGVVKSLAHAVCRG
jgi:hypothetical protein